MSQYLPFGREIIMTNEQIAHQDNMFNMYETYGIPYGILDSEYDGEQYISAKDKDRETARMLITQHKEIPNDLKERLLQYKKQEIE